MTINQEAARSEADDRPRVLCVDDEPHALEGLRHTLRRHFRVKTAVSGTEGLRCLNEEGPFTVVMSDFAMPGMNGGEFLSQARVAAPETVRILLTGQATLGNTIAAVNGGNVFRVLLKPSAPADLVQAIEDAVEQARLLTADRALLQRQLDAMSTHLVRAERLASLGTIAAAVGHELNNLLMLFGAARESLESALVAGVTPSPADLATLRQVQEHLSLHGRNLTNLGRPLTGAPPQTDLCEVVSEVLGSLSQAGILRRVHLKLEISGRPLPVRVSRVEIEQVLINLVKNAVDALAEAKPANPIVRIRTERGPTRGTARCAVSDNGDGIPAATVPLLFEPYYTTKPPHKGTGLGLFVIRQIANRAGGEVMVQSKQGHLTTFTVTLPLGDHAAESPVSATAASRSRQIDP